VIENKSEIVQPKLDPLRKSSDLINEQYRQITLEIAEKKNEQNLKNMVKFKYDQFSDGVISQNQLFETVLGVKRDKEPKDKIN
jgi:hypothetical protein